MSNSYLYGCFPSKSCTPLVRTGDTIIQYLLTPTSETGTSGNILSTGTIVSSYTTQKFPLNFVNVTISNLNNFVANLEIDISSLPIKNRVVFVALYTADNV